MPSRQSGVKALSPEDETNSEISSNIGLSSRTGGSALRSVKSSVTALVPGILTARWSRPRSARRGGQEGASVRDEEDIFIDMLVKAAFERQLAEDEVMAVLSTCPEVGWLAECSRRTPLPVGWNKLPAKGSNPRPRFQCEETGGVSDTPPHFQHFVQLAKLVTYARQSPAEASIAREHVQATVQNVQSQIEELERLWTGPHLDPDSGVEYYHCPGTGVSTWDNPFQGEMFLACVAERLLDSGALAIEKPEAEAPVSGRPSSFADRCRQATAVVEKASDGTAGAAKVSATSASVCSQSAAETDSDAWAALDDLIAIGYEPSQKPKTEQAWDAVSQLMAAQPAPSAQAAAVADPPMAASAAPAGHSAMASPLESHSATAPAGTVQGHSAMASPLESHSATAPAATADAAPALNDLPAGTVQAATTSAATVATRQELQTVASQEAHCSRQPLHTQEDEAAAEVRALRSTVAKLEQQVAELQSKGPAVGGPADTATGVSPTDMAALWQAMAALDAKVQKAAPMEVSPSPAQSGIGKVSELPRPDMPKSELDRVLSPRRRDVDQRAQLYEGGGATSPSGYVEVAATPQRLAPLPGGKAPPQSRKAAPQSRKASAAAGAR